MLGTYFRIFAPAARLAPAEGLTALVALDGRHSVPSAEHLLADACRVFIDGHSHEVVFPDVNLRHLRGLVGRLVHLLLALDDIFGVQSPFVRILHRNAAAAR